MVNVLVTGLPGDAKFTKLIYSFKSIFKKIQIRKFWIRELSDMYGSDCKQMTVEFSNSAEARKARTYLDNMRYTQGEMEYRLMASMDDDSYSPEYHEEREWGRGRRPVKRERSMSRSPSPGYRREATKLDLEIELLRKQRQVIEEERRLLLEQKKLEMIREYGPSASRDFDDFEPPRKRRHPSEMETKVLPRKRTPPPPKHSVPKSGPRGLPVFFQPCKKLIADMKEFINKDTTTEERDILTKLLRAAIRKNLAVALDGKDYMPTGEILKLYRELHPRSTDEFFVGKILSNIRASFLPDVLEGKISGTDSKTKGIKKQPENSEIVNISEVVVKDEIEGSNLGDVKVEETSEYTKTENNVTKTEEIPANEENGSGVDVEVKTELELSELNTREVHNEEIAEFEEENTESTAAEDAFISDLVEGTGDQPENGADVEVKTELEQTELNTSEVHNEEIAKSEEENTESTAADDAFISDLVEGTADQPENGEAVAEQ